MRIYLTLLLLMLAASPSRGQGVEIFAGPGASRMGGDDGSLGSGGSWTAGASMPLGGGWRVEGDLLWTAHERRIAGFPFEGTALGALGSISRGFGDARVEPFVILSLGAMRFSTTRTIVNPPGGETTLNQEETQRIWGGGGGARVSFTPHLLLRPQFRLLWSERTGVMGLASGTVALAYAW